ncbi:hypothetical protein K9N08_02305 [Candidatus Gracilibacteria bacterium]|nr:hypothetical protein [Candidatus Gracilibacteria bacterium]MCF7856368.1 hypothetical protein [Candidatus Gracilibacteria bacterium]MCF7896836.1 hypothetical protein [Candidatus Gracilibacteria bacterium]
MEIIKKLANLLTKNSTEKKELVKKISVEKNQDGKDLRTDKCPNCGAQLNKIPGAKTKCPHCEKFMYVRTRPKDRAKVLVTKKEADAIEKEWSEISFRNDWLKDLEQFGVTEKDFLAKKESSLKKFGQARSDRDIIWYIFNELILKNINDFQTLKMINYQMALFLNQEGRDCFAALQESAKMELLSLKARGVKKVQIITCGQDSCEACQKLDKRVFTIEEALEKKPIPCQDCTFKMYNEKHGFCRCMHGTEIDF